MTLDQASLEDVLTEDALLDLAGSGSFYRGQEYYEEGAVESIIRDGNTISAIVSGTFDYRVKLWVRNGHLAYSCSCPVGGRGEFCKHCVAAGLEWLEEGEDEQVSGSKPLHSHTTMDDVRTYLEGRDKNTLIDIIIKQAMDDESLHESLMLKAAAVSPEGVDVRAFRKAIDTALESEREYDGPYYEDYEGPKFDVDAVDKVLDAVEELVVAGYPGAAIDLTEYALERCEDELDALEYEDDGYLEVIQRLQDIHHSACLQLKPDPCELAKKLFDWGLSSDWGVFTGAVMDYADALGEKGFSCYRELAQAEWERALAEGEANRYSTIRKIMEALARQSGDIEALVEIKSSDLTASSDYLGIAEVYRGAGKPELAIEWAERGVEAFPGRMDARLRTFLIDEYRGVGRHHDALDQAWNAFTDSPSLVNYQRLKECADPIGEWPQWREKALSLIREWVGRSSTKGVSLLTSWTIRSDHSLLVEIFLWENDPESALHEAREGGCSNELWLQLAEKLEHVRPDDSINIYQSQIDRTVDETNNTAYEKAVRLLHRVNSVMDRIGRSDEFTSYLQSLRIKFFRKRNFIKLLNEAKWK